MPLTIGDRVGPYHVVAPLGAGGMGEVFRARDTSLNRDVALKIVAAAFADDAERLARFEREAQVRTMRARAARRAIVTILDKAVDTDAFTGWAGLWMRADGGSRQLAFDNMHDRAIRGTTPWTDYAIELSIPDGTEWLNFGFVLDGGGAMFMRDAKLSSRGSSGIWVPLGVSFGEADAHDAPTALLR